MNKGTSTTNAKRAWTAKMIVRDGTKSLLTLGMSAFANSHMKNNAVAMMAGSPKIRNANFPDRLFLSISKGERKN
jgi:hypothetical protein